MNVLWKVPDTTQRTFRLRACVASESSTEMQHRCGLFLAFQSDVILAREFCSVIVTYFFLCLVYLSCWRYAIRSGHALMVAS